MEFLADGFGDLVQRGFAFKEDGVDLEAAYAIDHGTVGESGKYDDGEGLEAKIRAEDFEQAAAVEVGQDQVEEDQIGRGVEHAFEGIAAVGDALDGVAARFQMFADGFECGSVVVNDQDFCHVCLTGYKRAAEGNL